MVSGLRWRAPSLSLWGVLPRSNQFLGRPGRENKLFKGTRLQGSRLVGRFYKYLLNKTLPVNWWHRARCGFPSHPGGGWESWSDKLVGSTAQPRWNQETQECWIWFRKWSESNHLLPAFSSEPPQLPLLVTKAGNHRGEDTHKQNTGHKNESLEELTKQIALVAVHSLAVSQQVEISLAPFNTANATGWQ